jgi:hypothetical protein
MQFMFEVPPKCDVLFLSPVREYLSDKRSDHLVKPHLTNNMQITKKIVCFLGKATNGFLRLIRWNIIFIVTTFFHSSVESYHRCLELVFALFSQW